jgi:hypothetical protein
MATLSLGFFVFQRRISRGNSVQKVARGLEEEAAADTTE